MKTIPLKTACELLDKAIFLSMESAGQDVTYHSWGLPDKDYECFLEINWQDEDGQEWQVNFLGMDNQNVEIDEEKMILVSEDGEKEVIGLVFKFANLADEISKL